MCWQWLKTYRKLKNTEVLQRKTSTKIQTFSSSIEVNGDDGNIDWSASSPSAYKLGANGLMVYSVTDAYVSYTDTLWPDLQKGSMEFVVNGADLKKNPGSAFYLFDMQENSDPNDDDKHIKLFRNNTDFLVFSFRNVVGDELLARINSSDLLGSSMPNGQVTVRVSWDINAGDYQDKATIKILDGSQEVFTGNNLVQGTSPDLGNNTVGSYNFFIASESSGKGGTQFPGPVRSFMIKTE